MHDTDAHIAHMQGDVIDTMLGAARAASVAPLRARRAIARANAQTSYDAIFSAANLDNTAFRAYERFALALFVSQLHRQTEASAFYRMALNACLANSPLPGKSPAAEIDAADLLAVVIALGRDAVNQGPYGAYPPGPLSVEDRPGPRWMVDASRREILGDRLAAAFDHAHLLVYHPRDAAARDLQDLLDSDWSSDDVIVLSQMLAFLTFQLRIVHGLAAVADMTALSAERAHQDAIA